MTIGSVKAVPRPGSQTMEEALNLLAAFGGGDKKNRKLLEDMKAVQVHNEEVYKQVHAAIQENSSLVAEAKRLNGEEREKIEINWRIVRVRLSESQLRDDALKEQELGILETVTQFNIEQANAESRRLQQKELIAEKERDLVSLEEIAENKNRQANILMEANMLKKTSLESISARLNTILADLRNV